MEQIDISEYLKAYDAARNHALDGVHVPFAFIEKLGLRDAAVLAQILYWHRPSVITGKPKMKIFREDEYWIAKSHKEWGKELGLQEKTVQRAMASLLKKGLIRTNVWHWGATPTLHVRLSSPEFASAFLKGQSVLLEGGLFGQNVQMEKDNLSKSYNHILPTESTEKKTCQKQSRPTYNGSDLTRPRVADLTSGEPVPPPVTDVKTFKRIPHQEVLSSWNAFCKRLHTRSGYQVLSPVKRLTDKRKRGIRNRFADLWPHIDDLYWEIEHSTFLQGGGNRNWKATFDWIWVDVADSAQKVLEGRYRDPDLKSVAADRSDNKRRVSPDLYAAQNRSVKDILNN